MPWLFDLLVTVGLVVGLCWGASKAAPVVNAALSTAVDWTLVALAGVAVMIGVRAGVVAVLNRRALARYAALEREAWAAQWEPPTLAEGARHLEAASSVRVEAFRVEAERGAA